MTTPTWPAGLTPRAYQILRGPRSLGAGQTIQIVQFNNRAIPGIVADVQKRSG
ncbi:hypothetical protein [Salinarimonas rosea]|uniref:hypothetical protein n=1 Tax=Salinarimonas rosea TaxID=552063 RepID=UPI0004173037|nr:hypothetical protein [Salinarimonas rosea]